MEQSIEKIKKRGKKCHLPLSMCDKLAAEIYHSTKPIVQSYQLQASCETVRMAYLTSPFTPPTTQQEMDIESLEAANQSLQADLKLAFKRIGDLQAAIEDEMESDDNEDLINRYCSPALPLALEPIR